MGGTYIDTYGRVIKYGINKKALSLDKLFLQGVMAGVFVGLAGHACSCLAGGFPTDDTKPGYVAPIVAKLLYAGLFPVAFISIILTGAELFTGNTMTMLICLFHRKVTLLDLLLNWFMSLFSNLLGTLIVSYGVSYLTGTFSFGSLHEFVVATAEKKLSYGWGDTFIRGIGANTFVCLALWQVIAVDDVAGKVLVLWFPIVAFCISGFEHIIANFYTILVGKMYQANISMFDIVFCNFAPTLLGNIVGGCVVVGVVYWYNCHDVWEEQQYMQAPELARSASMSLGIGRQISYQPPLTARNSKIANLDMPRRMHSDTKGVTIFPTLEEVEDEEPMVQNILENQNKAEEITK